LWWSFGLKFFFIVKNGLCPEGWDGRCTNRRASEKHSIVIKRQGQEEGPEKNRQLGPKQTKKIIRAVREETSEIGG